MYKIGLKKIGIKKSEFEAQPVHNPFGSKCHTDPSVAYQSSYHSGSTCHTRTQA